MTTKKFELVDIDVDNMTLKDKRAFSALYKMLLQNDEVIVPLTVDSEHKQICSFEQICLCFLSLQKALNNPLEIDLLEQVDTDGNKFFEIALTKVKAIEGTDMFPPMDEGKYLVRKPLQSELKRSNKKQADATAQADASTTDATAQADASTTDATAQADASTTDATAQADASTDAIADDNQSIACEIFAELKRKNFIKNQVKSTDVESLIFKIIQKYFG